MSENDKNIISGIGSVEGGGDVSLDGDSALLTGLFAVSPDETVASSAASAAPSAPSDDDDTAAPADDEDVIIAPRRPAAQMQGQRPGAPAQRPGTPAQRQGAPMQRQGAPAQRPAAPAQRPGMQPGRPAGQRPGAPANPPRTDARYNMSPAEIRTLASAAESAVANGRYGAALDSVFFTAGKARMALRDMINIRVPIGSRAEDLPGIAAAALITCYLQSETIDGDAILEQLRLIIESSEDEDGACPSADQVRLRVFECVLILCVQAEQSGKHPLLKEKLYRNEDSFLCVYLEKTLPDILADHRREVENFFNSVKLQSTEVKEIFEEYLEEYKPSPVRDFLKDFFAQSRGVMITAIVFGVIFLVCVVLHFLNYGSLMSFIATDDFIMTLMIILEVLFCGALLGMAWLVYSSGENKDRE